MGKHISSFFVNKRLYYTVFILIIIAILFSLPSKAILNAINNKIIRPLNNITIVIDPGHGGIDGGTSHGEILEKHINLTVGLKLKEVLIKRGANVIMTREADISLDDQIDNSRSRHREDLEARVKTANENEVDIFISIHVNHTKNEKKIGPIVFYDENSEESKRLATYIQDNLNKLSTYKKLDINIKHTPTTGNFFTLRNIKSPGVIVEMGFISNEVDRKLLLQDEHQEEMIDRIARSIIDYINEGRADL